MSAFLLDASAWLAAFDPLDPARDAARVLLHDAPARPAELAALDLTLYEVTNVAARRWGSPEMATSIAETIEKLCAGSLIKADAKLIEDSALVAEETGLSGYDAAYVTVARTLGYDLVSVDMADLVRPGFAITPSQAVEELRSN